MKLGIASSMFLVLASCIDSSVPSTNSQIQAACDSACLKLQTVGCESDVKVCSEYCYDSSFSRIIEFPFVCVKQSTNKSEASLCIGGCVVPF